MTKIFKALAVYLPLSVALMSVNQVTLAQEYTKIKRLGTSQSVCVGGVETPAQLQAFFANNPSAAREIFADAGWSGNADDFLAAVAAGEIAETSYPVGTKLAWMGAKVNGQNVANPRREWAGAEPFEAFRMDVSSNCNVYHLAIPKSCCNISLVSVSPDTTSAQCKEPEPVAPAPTPVAAPEPSSGFIPYVGAFIGEETRARFSTLSQLDVVDSATIVGIRAGLMREISDRASLFGQISYFERHGVDSTNVYPDDNLGLDFGLDYKVSPYIFIGGGIGVWNFDSGDFRDASLFGHIGGDFARSNFQWFIEGRIFNSDSEQFSNPSDNNMLSGGIRYLFK